MQFPCHSVTPGLGECSNLRVCRRTHHQWRTYLEFGVWLQRYDFLSSCRRKLVSTALVRSMPNNFAANRSHQCRWWRWRGTSQKDHIISAENGVARFHIFSLDQVECKFHTVCTRYVLLMKKEVRAMMSPCNTSAFTIKPQMFTVPAKMLVQLVQGRGTLMPFTKQPR